MSTTAKANAVSAMDIDSRVDAYTWSSISEQLDAHGWAMVNKLLTASECEAVAGLYADDRHFRSHIVMARHGFGRGEYKYFTYPLPAKVADLRTALYPRLVPIAKSWTSWTSRKPSSTITIPARQEPVIAAGSGRPAAATVADATIQNFTGAPGRRLPGVAGVWDDFRHWLTDIGIVESAKHSCRVGTDDRGGRATNTDAEWLASPYRIKVKLDFRNAFRRGSGRSRRRAAAVPALIALIMDGDLCVDLPSRRST